MLLLFRSFGFRRNNCAKLALEAVYRLLEQKNLAVEFSQTNAPNPPRLTQNSCLLRFRSFGFRRKNCAKLAIGPLYATFGTKNLAVEFFRNERTQSTPLTPKLMIVAFQSFRFRRNEWRETRPGGRS
jgi:hypothetical protein